MPRLRSQSSVKHAVMEQKEKQIFNYDYKHVKKNTKTVAL